MVMEWYDTGMVWYGIVCYGDGIVWYGLVWGWDGMGQRSFEAML